MLIAAGCATAPAGAAAAAPAVAARPPAAGAGTPGLRRRRQPPVLPGQPQPFATVIKDAKKIDGALTLWQKDDKVWIELTPEDFGQAVLSAPKIARGIGERGLFGGR